MSKIVLKKKKNPFVIMSKTALNDKTLSWKAKGLICYLLSLPEDWKVYVQDLKNRSKDSRDSTRTALNELIEANYIHRETLKRENGQFAGYSYYIYEEPTHEKPTSQQPKTENPTSVNPTLINNEDTEVLNNTNNTFNSMGEKNNFVDSYFDKSKKDVLDELKESVKNKEKNSAKKEIISDAILNQLSKFNNHMISKKGKKWYTRELKEAQLEYISDLLELYTDVQIIQSMKEAIRNSFVTFSPEYSINRQKKYNNANTNNSNNQTDIYTSFNNSLYDNQ